MTEAVIVWPDVLPVWKMQGYSHNPNLQRVTVDEKLGFSPGARIRQKVPVQIIKASLELDDLQKSLFDWWWLRKVYKGAVWFRAPVSVSGTMAVKRMRIIDLNTGSYTNNSWPISLQAEVYD
ncbi:hypothetical protein [Endozoicomonas sp. ISHI1]|uniref:hypothetical protein n=1 Tax=Endozoicomonas sp. ISHI1 TaxID=2825882 RepID=UPI0021494066|nr:hypothetical protein [Endozoicomonas sp. ISHI1]